MGWVAPWHVRSSWTRDWTRVPCIGRWILNHWATREAPAASFEAPPMTPCLSLPLCACPWCRSHLPIYLCIPSIQHILSPPLLTNEWMKDIDLVLPILALHKACKFICLQSLTLVFRASITNALCSGTHEKVCLWTRQIFYSKTLLIENKDHLKAPWAFL